MARERSSASLRLARNSVSSSATALAGQAARTDVDLDIELPELSLKILVGDSGEHVRVAHRRILIGIDEIELDLQASERPFEIKPGLGKHLRQHVQATPHLTAIPLPVLSGEVPTVDVLAHDSHPPIAIQPKPDRSTARPLSAMTGSGCRHLGHATSCQSPAGLND